MFWETFWATMWGALGGAVVGAVTAWLFSLDLRKREREDRQQERDEDRRDREEERAQDRLHRQFERDAERAERMIELEQGAKVESARRWLAIGTALSTVLAVPESERPRLLAEAAARVSDAYVLSPPDERPLADALKRFSPKQFLDPACAGAISGILNKYSRGEYDVEVAVARLNSVRAHEGGSAVAS